MPFIALPQEILIHTLSYLDPRSILSCASTCRLLYETCKNSLEIQYLVELAIDGFQKPITSASHSELIARLRDLRLSWANLDCKRFKKVELSNLCMAYELVAGVFAMADGHKLNFTWLPSSTMNGRSLTYPSLEFRIIDFAMDPTQDLIVILEDHNSPITVTDTRHVRLHIRSISAANDVHPLASEGILTFDDSDTIGPPLPPIGIQHFTLLTRTSFVLTLTSSSGSLQLYTFSPSSPTLTPASLCCTLHLPSIRPNCTIFELRVHSGPISACQPDPFTFSTELEKHSASYRLYVHKRTFLDYISRFRQDGKGNPHTAADVDWDDWDTSTAQGSSAATKSRRTVQVLNFNIPSCTLNIFLNILLNTFRPISSTSISAPHPTFKLHDAPTTNYPTHIFQEDFITRLPYYSTTRVVKVEESEESFFACMIDEERVIGISMSELEKMILHVCAF
ncbi:hypothetical protein CPB84DRAFT_1854352 [Gymnopilus junonius]|uniref:F-box domain-containing protein n=1 Tax=Gymnopilus junonius TaxID=109634 RepID=A0A9P5TF05_GYMJU|nr:hypothetical protein CPB84DRAFT_1854352 [Gymnopilus junonius]